jgi:hypothetical protein
MPAIPAAAVPVRPEADVIDAGDLDHVQQRGHVLLERGAPHLLGLVELAPLADELGLGPWDRDPRCARTGRTASRAHR